MNKIHADDNLADQVRPCAKAVSQAIEDRIGKDLADTAAEAHKLDSHVSGMQQDARALITAQEAEKDDGCATATAAHGLALRILEERVARPPVYGATRITCLPDELLAIVLIM
jgi:hypothetical protein